MNKITCTKTAPVVHQRGQLYKSSNEDILTNLYILTRTAKDTWLAISLLNGNSWIGPKQTSYGAIAGLTLVPAGSEYTLVAE